MVHCSIIVALFIAFWVREQKDEFKIMTGNMCNNAKAAKALAKPYQGSAPAAVASIDPRVCKKKYNSVSILYRSQPAVPSTATSIGVDGVGLSTSTVVISRCRRYLSMYMYGQEVTLETAVFHASIMVHTHPYYGRRVLE